MKAKPKAGLIAGTVLDVDGHADSIVESMEDRSDIMNLEPYRDFDGNVIPNWYVEIADWGYNWHISWLDVIDP